MRIVQINRSRTFQHFGPSKHISGNGAEVPQLMAGPIQAGRTSVACSGAMMTNQVYLPVVSAIIGFQKDAQRLGRRLTRLEELKAIIP
jgi:hypothetical protein